MQKSIVVGSFLFFVVALYGAQAFAAVSEALPPKEATPPVTASQTESLAESAQIKTNQVVLESSQKPSFEKVLGSPEASGQTFPQEVSTSAPTTSVVGTGGNASGTATAVVAPSQTTHTSQDPTTPVRVIIPKIALNNPVVQVGLTSDGAMDVPSGKTNNVGWYKDGTVPGEQGSAVLDAHVFAAFSRLDELTVGDEIYVTDKDGVSRRFIVEEATTYVLKDVPAKRLFNGADAKRLNLITCAGKLTADRSTYTHRLVVYAVLAE